MGPDLLVIIIVAVAVGVLVGSFTGLVPGIHVNTAATVLVAAYPALAASLSGIVDAEHMPVLVACCVFSASTVHSFVDFVPSVFIGAPDPDEALSVLPGHRLLAEGRGMRAVRAAAVGSVVGALTAVLLALPLQWLMLHGGMTLLDRVTLSVLLLALIIIVLSSRRKILALVMIAVSGFIGLAVNEMGIPSTGLAGEGTLLFPMLTGMFGLPPLLERGARTRAPRQRDDGEDPVGPVPGLKGVVTGLLAGWFPGITSTVGATMASAFGRDDSPESFIAMTASIGTVTSVFSVVALAVSGSGRSGTTQAVKEIIGNALDGFCSEAFVLILFSIAAASAVGYVVTIAAGKGMMHLFDAIPGDLLNDSVLVLITALVFVFTGPWGLVVLAVCAAVGMIPPALGVSRVTMAAALLVPTLLSQLGLTEQICAVLGWPLRF